MSNYIILFLALAFALLSAVVSTRFYLSTKDQTGRLPRAALGSGYQIIAQQVLVLLVMLVVGFLGGVDLYDLGASGTINPFLAFLVGFAVYFAVLGLVELLARVLGIRDRLHDLSFETMRLIWPRKRKLKFLAIIAVCVINPFTEEVIYRGVLIHYFGEMIDSIFLAAVIGFVLSIAAHMYQGSWSVPFQMMFHGAAVILLVSPFGLVACFGFHFAGDLVPVVLFKRSMIEWRDRRRREKSLAR